MLIKDRSKAIGFAESVLFDIYGKKQITSEKPYHACYVDNYWIISGSLREGWDGGTFLIVIDATNYRIVRITHGK